ncbi:MAG: 6,7-dimethyl-8-ribityllumazine synthase [Balneolaceae bacterium]|nr:6,7-dimethyl-8-ribityllumazine synthase [Balneolaceae bacterium]MBO6547620.1 6,7-dimethyl-8-ribityllumazine synthase [Balneolaceae bacterium]MBO6648131.1 6,7-dimethyl-8-ribityllumazine synthase [Balneolaceae bacterium]
MSVNIVDEKTGVKGAKIGIVVSRWNSNITEKMLNGALSALKGNGVKDEDVLVVRCPGSFEIPLAVQNILEHKEVEGVIALGVVIRGGTPHFEYVCDAVTSGVLELNLKYQKPVAFGVLTTDDVKQAMDRAGEKGNKGGEAALALLEMINIKRNLSAK